MAKSENDPFFFGEVPQISRGAKCLQIILHPPHPSSTSSYRGSRQGIGAEGTSRYRSRPFEALENPISPIPLSPSVGIALSTAVGRWNKGGGCKSCGVSWKWLERRSWGFL